MTIILKIRIRHEHLSACLGGGLMTTTLCVPTVWADLQYLPFRE